MLMQEFESNLREIACLWKSNGNTNYSIQNFLCNDLGGVKVVFKDTRTEELISGKPIRDPTLGEGHYWPRLRHRNIAQLTDLITISPEITVFMTPYLEKTLKEYIHAESFVRSPKCLKNKKLLILDVLRGLNYLHRQSLSLLNLSDVTVFICEEKKKAVISDFSHLVHVDKVKECKVDLPQFYNAPELEGQVLVDQDLRPFLTSIDIWAAGVLAFEIILNHLVPWSLVNYDSSRILCLIDRLDYRMLKAANMSSYVSAKDVSDCKIFLSSFLQTDPALRWSSKKLIGSDFLQRPKQCIHYSLGEVCGRKSKQPNESLQTSKSKFKANLQGKHDVDFRNSHSTRHVSLNKKRSYKVFEKQRSFVEHSKIMECTQLKVFDNQKVKILASKCHTTEEYVQRNNTVSCKEWRKKCILKSDSRDSLFKKGWMYCPNDSQKAVSCIETSPKTVFQNNNCKISSAPILTRKQNRRKSSSATTISCNSIMNNMITGFFGIKMRKVFDSIDEAKQKLLTSPMNNSPKKMKQKQIQPEKSPYNEILDGFEKLKDNHLLAKVENMGTSNQRNVLWNKNFSEEQISTKNSLVQIQNLFHPDTETSALVRKKFSQMSKPLVEVPETKHKNLLKRNSSYKRAIKASETQNNAAATIPLEKQNSKTKNMEYYTTIYHYQNRLIDVEVKSTVKKNSAKSRVASQKDTKSYTKLKNCCSFSSSDVENERSISEAGDIRSSIMEKDKNVAKEKFGFLKRNSNTAIDPLPIEDKKEV